MPNLTLELNVFDDQGILTGETREVSLSIQAIQDILDQSASLAIRFRNEAETPEISGVLAAMLDALEDYEVVPKSNATPDR
jgi:hypothetical protein